MPISKVEISISFSLKAAVALAISSLRLKISCKRMMRPAIKYKQAKNRVVALIYLLAMQLWGGQVIHRLVIQNKQANGKNTLWCCREKLPRKRGNENFVTYFLYSQGSWIQRG